MEISFAGGASTVTGSKFLLREGSTAVLVDCGLFQGVKSLRNLNWEDFNFDPREVDAVLLTHAHLDHCGALPLLVKKGFKGPIYCTEPTLDLAKIVLLDAAKIQEEEAEYANRKKYSKHNPALALYTIEDTEKIFSQFKAVSLHEEITVGDFKVTYFSAGHILGASSVQVRSTDKTLYFSGDLGRSNDPLMPAPELPQKADIVFMESTYGNRVHSPISTKEILRDCIMEAVQKKSVLLIPSFSVGRAQNILFEIEQLRREGEIPPSVPVYFNSPMGMEASALYSNYADFLKVDDGAFDDFMSQVQEVRTAEDSKALNESLNRPLVIIAASGMLTGGRVLHHVKAFAGDPKNILLLAGYQAAGTRGRDLIEGKKELKIHGQIHPIKCKIVSSDSFSAHADQTELLQWLAQAPEKPKKVFLIHGETEAAEVLAEKIRAELHLEVEVPGLDKTENL